MQEPASIHPAVLFEPDGYRTDIEKLMGRQSAGMGFLRAAVGAARAEVLACYTPRKASADVFAQTIAEIDPAAKGRWISPSRPDQLQQARHLYLPGPGLGEYARLRLRTGPHAWSLTGVTHTTASHGVMDALADMQVAPVMPWDALVCTSNAVRATVETVLGAQQDYLRWRFGGQPSFTLPQLPVIPLGVHCKDFAIDAAQRIEARKSLGIADDEVVFLFIGRLSFHAKAHPHAMYLALQAAAKQSGRKVMLVQCGWFANKPIEDAFRQGASTACPDVRCLYTDGRAVAQRKASWAAADVFISLSDNIQETFGLTPIEAMAAGLPVVVTDWDGYKDTVRDGVDGFRITTWAPPPGVADVLAWAHEIGADTYDMYCGLTCAQVSVDHRMLAERCTALVQDEALRKKLGEAGRARAAAVFDWAVVYRAYQELWAALDRSRPKEPVKAPRVSPSRLDPFVTFGHYPTHQVAADSVVRRSPGATSESFAALAATPLFSFAARVQPPAPLVEKLFAALATGGISMKALCDTLGAPQPDVVRATSVLAKMGLVELASGK